MLTTVMLSILTLGQAGDAPVIAIDRDNVQITQSCRVRIAQSPIIDADNNGVIHITASDIAVEFADDSPALHGAKNDQTPDTFAGKGIVITGQNVILSGAKVSGYKVDIHAMKADGLTLHHCDVSNNFHQRLKSTPQAEDASDWLWPHANDNNEWITNYGAGLCVEDSNNVTLHDVRARKTQNGIILDAVHDSKVYDCDCSFLSGWGLAMWRSNRNVISRNAFDFCVRGYSHGVYSRGQDSAGILMFEQCCENLIVENSATHGGDGLFAFAGKEALGEANPRDDLQWYKRRGNNDNLFAYNDFSYAAAHGLELTFSFGNRITGNTFRDNAICGIWGGYSQQTGIGVNIFRDNGGGAYGLERGGINIEHGRENLILQNHFMDNRCGVHLWWDDDKSLFDLPWSRANLPDESAKRPAAMLNDNEFSGDEVALHLRHLDRPVLLARNLFHDVKENTRIEGASTIADDQADFRFIEKAVPQREEILGTGEMRGRRAALAGRHHIIMTEWGPYDWKSYLLQRIASESDLHHCYRLHGVFPRIFHGLTENTIQVTGDVEVEVTDQTVFIVRPRRSDVLIPYTVSIRMNDDDDGTVSHSGTLTGGTWTVKTFASPCDPREDVERWRAAADAADAHSLTCAALDLPFGSGGMSDAMQLPQRMPSDHFGTIATRTLTIPLGRWRITTTSDDGIRVWMDEQLVIDDWTHHAPKKHTHDFEVAEGEGERGRTIDFRVEHFELDGYAVLQLEIDRLPN